MRIASAETMLSNLATQQPQDNCNNCTLHVATDGQAHTIDMHIYSMLTITSHNMTCPMHVLAGLCTIDGRSLITISNTQSYETLAT